MSPPPSSNEAVKVFQLHPQPTLTFSHLPPSPFPNLNMLPMNLVFNEWMQFYFIHKPIVTPGVGSL